MQRRRIEVGSVGPDQRVNFGIDSNLIEQRKIAQGLEQLSGEHLLKVNRLL